MIKLITGVCSSPEGLKRPESGSFCLSETEEAYLVSRNVAEYVSEPVATPSDGEIMTGVGVNTSDNENGADGQELTGHLDVDDLMMMALADLRKMAADMEIDTAGLKTKAEYATAIAAVEVTVEPAAIVDEMPDLNAEAPVE